MIVPEGTLVEWIRNGNRFVQDHAISMTVVGAAGNLKGINNTLDYLYRNSTDPQINNLCAIAFYGFYERIRIRNFKGATHLPRHLFEANHPQATTHCLVRMQCPKVPEAISRVVRIPIDWEADVEDMMTRTEEDEQRVNEFALHILARYYPLHAKWALHLPEAATLYDRVKLWWRQSIVPNPNHTWMLRNLQNLNDSSFGGKPPAHWESDADEEHVATRVRRPDDDSSEPPPTQPKFKNRLAHADLQKFLKSLRSKFGHYIQPPELDVYESTTATVFKSYAKTHPPAKMAGSTRMPMPIYARMDRQIAEKVTTGKYTAWTKAIRAYRVSRIGDTMPTHSADPAGPISTAGTSEPGIHGTVPVSDSALPAQGQRDNEPSWERLLQRPTQAQAIHLWGLRKMQALAFVKVTDPLLKFQRTAAGIPILNMEHQVLLLIVGEAGTGKSRVIRAVCWMVHQYGIADWLVLSSHQGRPVANLRNPAVRGMTSSVLHKIDSRHGNKPAHTNISKTALSDNFARLGMVMTDEASLSSADHMAVCSTQAIRGLADRADPDAPFGGLNQVLVFDHLQHTPVKNGSLWYGQASSVAQAWAATSHSNDAPAQDRLENIAAGTAIIQQFHEVIFLDEQIRQDKNVEGAHELHQHLTDIRKNMRVTEKVLDAMNSRAIGMPGMPKTISEVKQPIFIVPRHSLIDIINKQVVPARAAESKKRLIRFYAEIVARDNDDEDHRLPKALLDLARQRPKLGKLITQFLHQVISAIRFSLRINPILYVNIPIMIIFCFPQEMKMCQPRIKYIKVNI